MNEISLDYRYQINGFHKDIYNIDIQAVTKGHGSSLTIRCKMAY